MKECKCVFCGNDFFSKDNKERKTCSKDCRSKLVKQNQSGENHPCYSNGKAIKQEYTCLKCGDTFISDKGYNSREPKYCSKSCYSEALKIERQTIKCKECGVLFVQKYLQKTPDFCSLKCSTKNNGKRMKGKPNGRTGELAGGWKGGLTKEHDLIRRGLNYKLWRTSVFERDNYTCVHCRVKGGKLQADHIKPFSKFKELRFDINNGRTLCVECHKKTDTYGSKMLTYGIQKAI